MFADQIFHNPTASSAAMMALSEARFCGSAFRRRLPWKKCGSCGIVLIRSRRMERGMEVMAWPDIVIVPESRSSSRRIVETSDDFPL